MNWLIYERFSRAVVSCVQSDTKPVVMNHHDVVEYPSDKPPALDTIRITEDGTGYELNEQALDMVRSAALRAVNSKREAVQRGGCMTSKGMMDSDGESRLLLAGAIQMAQIALSQGQPFMMGWTMADDATIDHGAMELITAGVMMGRFIAQAHATAVGLKAAINAAQTLEAIEAIDIEGAPWIAMP